MPVPLTTALLLYAAIMTATGIATDSAAIEAGAAVFGFFGVVNQLMVELLAPAASPPGDY